MEAISSEVGLLRKSFPSSVAWGLTHRRWACLSWKRGFCLHPNLHLVFRLTTKVLEPIFQINHIFGSVGDWFYLAAKRWRPTVLTMAAMSAPVEFALLERVDQFVVEHSGGQDYLLQLGICPDRIRTILPPVDLSRFTPHRPPKGPMRVLFASSPDRESWLEARGIPQILDAAAARPHINFRLLWRPWGDSVGRVRQWIAERKLDNVELVVKRSSDMSAEYQAAHVVLVPFTDTNRSKPAPNSLIEGLACGRPAVVTETVGLAQLVRDANAGIVCNPDGNAIAESLDHLASSWDRYSGCARRLAEQNFGADKFIASYSQLYHDVLANQNGGSTSYGRPRSAVRC